MLKASHIYILPVRCRCVIFVLFSYFILYRTSLLLTSYDDVITPFLGTYFVITYILVIYKMRVTYILFYSSVLLRWLAVVVFLTRCQVGLDLSGCLWT